MTEHADTIPRGKTSITKTCSCNIQNLFSPVKIENFIVFFFLIFAQITDCWNA